MKTSKPPASRSAVSLLLVSALMGLASCERTKTSNPLSPQVAGPMAGVTVTPAVLAEPPVGSRIKDGQQPITLVIINASSNIARPLTMTVQIAADTSFTGQSYSQTGITPSTSGVTRLTLPGKLPGGRTYFWRVKADDGANTSGWSSVSNFVALEPIVLGPPDPRSPAGNVRVTTNMPEFEVGNATASGPVGGLWYQFEISERSDFATIYTNAEVSADPGGITRYTMPPVPAWDRTLFWRVRLMEPETTGPWSRVESFRSPFAPPSAPPPPSGGGPSHPVGDWQQCGSLSGNKQALVACVHGAVNPPRTEEGAFEVTKRVAWLLRGEGAGLLIKNGGENIVGWMGYSFSAGRICYPDGHIFKVLSDIPSTNGPSWQDNDFVDRSLYVPAINPGG
jgi:hypothetical protein